MLGEELLQIYDKVYGFILTNRLILYGGMSTDYLLKLKGHQGIYGPEEEPDYDFYTYDMNLAYDLADLLSKDHQGVHVINAWHPQTLRVKWQKTVVADLSFMPKKVFDNMPTMNYVRDLDTKKASSSNTLRLTHPKFKMADVHKALISPTKGCPKEAVFQRFLKDMVKYNLLDKAFPDDPIKQGKRVEVSFKLDLKQQDYLITGLYAYCLIVNEFHKVFGKIKDCEFIKVLDLGKDTYEVDEVSELLPSIIVTKYEELVKESEVKELRAPWMDDLLPRSARTSKLVLYEHNSQVTYHSIGEHKIINIHGVMLYFLVHAFMDTSFKKSTYYQYYLSLKNIISYVQEPFLNGSQSELSQESPFFVNMNVWKEVESLDHLIKKHELRNRAEGSRESAWPLPTYVPGRERPVIKDNILLYMGYETLKSFKGYRDLLDLGDVF